MDFGIHENLFLQILCGFSGSVYLYNARIHILYLCIHAHVMSDFHKTLQVIVQLPTQEDSASMG